MTVFCGWYWSLHSSRWNILASQMSFSKSDGTCCSCAIPLPCWNWLGWYGDLRPAFVIVLALDRRDPKCLDCPFPALTLSWCRRSSRRQLSYPTPGPSRLSFCQVHLLQLINGWHSTTHSFIISRGNSDSSLLCASSRNYSTSISTNDLFSAPTMNIPVENQHAVD